MFTAILGALLGEDWTTPRIEELRITPDHCLLARPVGDATFKVFLGAEADLIRNIHGLSGAVTLTTLPSTLCVMTPSTEFEVASPPRIDATRDIIRV